MGQPAAGVNQNNYSLNTYFLIFFPVVRLKIIHNWPILPTLQGGGCVGERVLRYTAEVAAASRPSQHFH